MLEIKGLNVHYGVIHALKDVDLVITPGMRVAIVGPTGAGKTTIVVAPKNVDVSSIEAMVSGN